MRILFIRHGKPDYSTDTLTEIGLSQARDTAQRVKNEGISELYASTMGRAAETAAPISKLLGLSVIPCDFMREVEWGSEDGEDLLCEGNPWFTLPVLIRNGESVTDPEWQTKPPFDKNAKLIASINRVITGADAWLASLGFLREGDYYRVGEEATDKTVAMVSHGGASTALFSHLFNIPFPRMCSMFRPYFCSVSVIEFSGKPGELCTPKIKLLSDDRHVIRDNDNAEIKR